MFEITNQNCNYINSKMKFMKEVQTHRRGNYGQLHVHRHHHGVRDEVDIQLFYDGQQDWQSDQGNRNGFQEGAHDKEHQVSGKEKGIFMQVVPGDPVGHGKVGGGQDTDPASDAQGQGQRNPLSGNLYFTYHELVKKVVACSNLHF